MTFAAGDSHLATLAGTETI